MFLKTAKGKAGGLIVLIVIAVLVAGALWYLAGSYPASAEARSYLSTGEDVTVSDIENGLFLDGPGTETALVFYPGGKVEYTSYLPLLYPLAKDGMDVFLLKMPADLAVFGKDRAGDIMAAHTYDHWYLAGHSLGGAMAAVFAAETEQPPEGLILLAAYPTKKLPDIRVLELYGSEDRVLNREKLAEGCTYLPADAVVMEIPGGNHAQFGSYGPQKGDGTASISASVQQEVTVEMIEDLLYSRPS